MRHATISSLLFILLSMQSCSTMMMEVAVEICLPEDYEENKKEEALLKRAIPEPPASSKKPTFYRPAVRQNINIEEYDATRKKLRDQEVLTQLKKLLTAPKAQQKFKDRLQKVYNTLIRTAEESGEDAIEAQLLLPTLTLPTFLLNDPLQKTIRDLEDLLYSSEGAYCGTSDIYSAQGIISPFIGILSALLNEHTDLDNFISCDLPKHLEHFDDHESIFSPRIEAELIKRTNNRINQSLMSVMNDYYKDRYPEQLYRVTSNTPLHFAANEICLQQLIQAYPSKINAKNYFGMTPLHVSILKKDGEGKNNCELLLQAGANPNIPFPTGSTPLEHILKYLSTHHNSQKGAAKICKLLLAYGADPDASDQKGKPLILRAFELYQTYRKFSPLMEDLFICYLHHAKNVDVQYGLDDTLLHNAVDAGYEKIVDKLLERGAAIDIKNMEKATPIHIALILHPRLASKLLLNAVFEPKSEKYQLQEHSLKSLTLKCIAENPSAALNNYASIIKPGVDEFFDEICTSVVNFASFDEQKKLVAAWHACNLDPCPCTTLLCYALDRHYDKIIELLSSTEYQGQTLAEYQAQKNNTGFSKDYVGHQPYYYTDFKHKTNASHSNLPDDLFAPEKAIHNIMPYALMMLVKTLEIKHEFDGIQTPQGLVIQNK